MGRPRKDAPTGFAWRLKAIREEAGLTQQELASRCGMNRFGIAKLEQEGREPAWPTVLKLAAALGVPCTAFQVVDGEAESTEKPKARGRPKKSTS